jgi:Rhs element Vgr protein
MAIDQQELLHVFHIKINGADLPDSDMHRVAEVVVEQSLHLPDMFIIRLHDYGGSGGDSHHALFRLTDAATFAIGNPIEIAMGWNRSAQTVFKGEITHVELEATATSAPLLTVRGYARSHRLHRGRYQRSFLNVTDSDLAKKIAGEVGLSAQTDSTPVVHDYVFQNNQTNWEFLKERALRNGYELFVDDRSLYFRKPKVGQNEVPAQTLGAGLLSVRIMQSSSFQANQVTVQAWDPKTKQQIVGQATSGGLHPSIGLGKTGAQVSQSAFGPAKHYVVSRPVASQSEATTLAQAICDDLDGSFIQVEGVCIGNTQIVPGKTVELKGLGTKLSGKYYVTSATHTISPDQGYTTSFVVSGRQTNSILELTQSKSDGPSMPSVVVGIVTNNTDPDDQGRVKVKFPWLAEQDESWWARIASPMAGSSRGFFFLPEVDDEVLVSFEHGDLTRPFIIGMLWNGKDLPPKKSSQVVGGSKVNERLIKTRAGHVISLDDTDGSEKITIVDKTGKNSITFESSSNTITIMADGDVSIQTKGNTKITAQQNVNVETQQNATVKATQNVDVEATGNATVKATGNASVEATGNLELKGSVVNVEAQGALQLKASGPLTIQGAIVNIN